MSSVDLTSGKPVVSFSVRDALGRGAVGLGGGSTGNVRFTIAKLTPPDAGSGDSSAWQNYILRNGAAAGLQGAQDRAGTLVDNGDGTYVYTFVANIKTIATVTYDATLTHRLAVQVSGKVPNSALTLPPLNFIYDFVPAGVPAGGTMYTREIVDIDNCKQCHGTLLAHGSRYETQLCVTCHNPGTAALTIDGGVTSVDMKVFIHKIHRGVNLPSTIAGGRFTVGSTDFSDVTFPQDLRDCRKCHNGDTGAANKTSEGNNWRKVPTMEACGSCHDNVNYATGLNHTGGVQTSNKLCTTSGCHDEAKIEQQHTTSYLTPNNPNVPIDLDGGLPVSQFRYELLGVSSLATNDGGGDYPVVDFNIYRDEVPMTLTGTALPAYVSGSPSFIIASTAPQIGMTVPPAEYTNPDGADAGAGQPRTITLTDLRAASAIQQITAPDGGTAYRATFIRGVKWPAGTSMRAVALQGAFSQSILYQAPSATSPKYTSFSRHTPTAVMGLTGDIARRVVVDNTKCLKCHEMLDLHGGARVNNTAVCVMCHNPNFSSTGRTSDGVLFAAVVADGGTPSATLTYNWMVANGIDPTKPLTWPEASLNLKDLVHGLHSADIRTAAFVFTRASGTSGATYNDWSDVTFPQIKGNCLACHVAGTYAATAVPANALPSTWLDTAGGTETRDSLLAARAGMPNATDEVRSPLVSTCSQCHDSDLARLHMQQNGGVNNGTRSSWVAGNETCAICHGPGRLADVDVLHPNQ